MTSITQAFSELHVTIDDRLILQMEHMVIAFETRLPGHLMALNSQMIGVHPIAFLDSDRSALFQLCHVSEKQMSAAIHQVPAINPAFKVPSDPFNLLCVWLLHVAVIYIADPAVRLRFQMSVAKYLHYRFFTSLVNYRLPHGANEDVMTAVVNSLTQKFDIVVYGSWRKALEARCVDLLSKESIHYHTIQTAAPDAKVLYILTDVQTRLRDKINTMCEIYYKFHQDGIKIGSKGATTTDREGEKILVSRNSVFDAAISNVSIEILNVHQFVDRPSVALIARQFSSVSTTMLCAVLTEWSALATEQTRSQQFDYVDHKNGTDVYIGARALVSAIIQTSFRYCISNRIALSSKARVWVQLKNVYSSSRVTTPDVLAVKDSVGLFVEQVGKTSRDSTKASLRLALIMYVIYRALRFV